MSDPEISPEQIASITEFVDIEAKPSIPTAHLVFGTNQQIPALIAAERHHAGLAPFIIVTGGVNRHNGIVEGREFADLLSQQGVPPEAIRCEDQSANTWENVERASSFIHEALSSGLSITAVCKWYHRRAIHILGTLVPELDAFYALSWEPVYGGASVTRENWHENPEGEKRVIREWQEVRRRIADGSFRDMTVIEGAWQAAKNRDD